MVLVRGVGPLGRLALVWSQPKVVADADALDNQDPLFALDLAHGFRG